MHWKTLLVWSSSVHLKFSLEATKPQRVQSPTFTSTGGFTTTHQSSRPFSSVTRTASITLVTTGAVYLLQTVMHVENLWSQLSLVLCKISCRDTPDSLPAFVGENEAKKGYAITKMGDNVFAAVLWVPTLCVYEIMSCSFQLSRHNVVLENSNFSCLWK